MSHRPSVPYAGLVSRTLALALDGLLLTTVIVVVGTVVGVAISLVVPGDTHVDLGVGLVAAALGVWWLIMGAYLVCFWTLAAQTPGMRLMRLRVTSLDGHLLRPGRALVRLAGMVLAALPLMAGYALILVDDRRRGLHDMLARTRVVYVAEGDAETFAAAAESGLPGLGQEHQRGLDALAHVMCFREVQLQED
jgi:uncharacterized RDD family membrane protein YckC